MADIEHPIAVYFNEKDERRTIRADELKEPAALARARLLELYDASEQVRVAPRISKHGTPHFYATTRGGRKVFSAEATDPRHNDRIKELMQGLKLFDVWSLTLVEKRKAEGKANEISHENVLKLPKYRWQAEVHRILAEDTVVRHDIFGQSDELGMSVRRPWIAIEVIRTHFPEEAAFSAMLQTSKRMPLIVLFDFVDFKNSFVKVDNRQRMIAYRPWTFFIWDGRVWKGRKPTAITTSAGFEIEVKNMTNGW